MNPSSIICHALSPSSSGVVTYDDPAGQSRAAVLALEQDARGYLWIGTQYGPVRFDGLEWHTPTGLAALSTCEAWAFNAQESGAIWIGTGGAGLWHVATQATPHRLLSILTTADGLADSDIHVLCRDTAGALWAGTHHGLAMVDGQRAGLCWTARDGIPEAGICALHADPTGGMWAGSLHGLLHCDKGGIRACLTCRDGLPDPAVYALCVDAEGRLWAGTRNGIALLRDGRVVAAIRDGLPSPEVRTLCLDHVGRMWAGTARGLALLEGDAVRRCWTRAEQLPSASVWSLLCDRENHLWIGTERGLAVLPGQRLAVRPIPLGEVTEGGAHAFAGDQSDRMWIGTANGLVAVSSDTQTETTPTTLPPILAHAGAWAVHHDGAGRLWVAGRYGGLHCLEPATGETLAHIDAINAARCLLDDAVGRLWIGTLGAGIACVDRKRGTLLHRLTVEHGLPSDHISSFCLDGKGRLWVGTLGGGLACVDCRHGRVSAVLGAAEGLPHPVVSGLAPASANRLWVTTQGGGLCRLDLTTERIDGVWGVADGLPSDILVSCAVDAEGTLWLGTVRGLARFQPATGACLVLGRLQGLPGDTCQQGALLLDRQARLWVGTDDGVAVVATRDLPPRIPACVVYLNALHILGHERELIDGQDIEDSEYDLLIDYGAVTFDAAEQVLYRTRLLGLESAWSRPQPHRFARYTNLRPGAYTFQVAARNWGGQWSTPAQWRFRVIRNRAAHELESARQRAEAAETAVHIRNDVLSTVAHDLRTPLTAIMGHAGLLELRLEGATPPPDWLRTQAKALHEGARRMASMVDEIMDVARLETGRRPALEAAPVDVGLLAQAIARAPETSRGRDILAELDTADLVIEGDVARLERVVQNLIGNAVKYSDPATPVHVVVRRHADGVTLIVRDHGIGIPAEELPRVFTPYYRASTAQGIPGTGLGLAGAKSIVEQHGGSITLCSRAGHGTTVKVYLPRRVPAHLPPA